MSEIFENGGFVNREKPQEVNGEYTYAKNHPRIKYHHESTSNDLEYYGSVETDCKTLAEFAKALPVGVYTLRIKAPQLITILGCDQSPVYLTWEMVMDTRTNNHEGKPIWRKYKDIPIISIQYRDGLSGTTFYVKLAFLQKKAIMQKIMFNETYGLTEAVLQGRKTMTRRMISKHFPTEGVELIGITGIGAEFRIGDNYEPVFVRLPYKVGEVVAIAQSYKDVYDSIKNPCELFSDRLFNSLLKEHKGWNNKMFVKAEFMPHRIRITDIKVERLQDISDEDCLKEGIIPKKLDYTPAGYPKGLTYYGFDGWGVVSDHAKDAFAALIDKVSGRGTWHANPWVFAYSFELVK